MKTIAILVSLCAAGAPAATIFGTVYDPSGAVVPNTAIALRDRASGNTQRATANESGQFRFETLPAGAYDVEAAAPGFKLAREGVEIDSEAREARADLFLQLGSIRENVRVQRDAAGLAAAAPAPVRVRVGGKVQPPKLLKMVRPAYPPSTAAAGPVVLRGIVLRDGALSALVVLAAPDPQLAASALDAVRQWRYQPVLLNGQPVEVETEIRLEFGTGQ